MKVTRIGDHVRIQMCEHSRTGMFEPGTLVTYYVTAHVYDMSFATKRFDEATGWTRVSMSSFVVVNGKIVKNRFLVEDLIEAFIKQDVRCESL